MGDTLTAAAAGLVSVRADIEAELEHAAGGLYDERHGERRGDPADYLTAAQVVAQLASALIDVDQVLMARGTRGTRTPPAGFEELLAVAWQATQDAGAPTAVGDAVLAAMRAAVAS